MLLRHAEPGDHAAVVAVVDDWWGGRPMAARLSHLFFTHFRPTSFVAVDGDRIVGFCCAFVGQSDPAVGYVHFVGVDPTARVAGLGRMLYERTFAALRAAGCAVVECVTSPINTTSVAFHTALGFTSRIEPDHDGPGEDRVVFRRSLDPVPADTARPVIDIASATAAHRAVVATLRAEDWDPRAPSLLPDWSIGHVVTHIARNADALRRTFDAAARGEIGAMYPHGRAGRAADIETGAPRPRGELVDDVVEACARLELAWATASETAWREGTGLSLAGPIRLAEWPARRRRETEVHHVDLGLAATVDDWSSAFVADEWDRSATGLADRLLDVAHCALDAIDGERRIVIATRPDAVGSDRTVEVRGTRRELIGWMLGRRDIADAPALEPWG